MIKNIDINIPSYGIKIRKTFTQGVNVISGPNGSGKTTILNSIASLYSGKFPGMKGNLDGIIKIETDTGTSIMSNKKWNTNQNQDSYNEYIIVGKFFTLSPGEQREVITDFLGINKEEHMTKIIPDWNEKSKSLIKKEIEKIENIRHTNLESIERFKEQIKNLESQIQDEENAINNINAFENNRSNEKDLLKKDLSVAENSLQMLRSKYTNTKNNTCSYCGSTINVNHSDLSLIKDQAEELKILINDIETKISNIPDPLFPSESYELINNNKRIKSNIQLVNSSIEYAQNEIKKNNSFILQEKIDSIIEAEKNFIEYVSTQVKSTGLDIELFKIKKSDGELTPTFSIKLDGKEYNELSSGYKMLLASMVAKIFIDKLQLDFVMIDESSILDKNNKNKIIKIFNGKQILMTEAGDTIL